MQLIKDSNINFVSKKMRRGAFIISGTLLIIGIIAFFISGGLKLGIDFAGGAIVQYKFDARPDLDRIRGELKDIGFGNSIIQNYGSKNEILIKIVDEKKLDELKENFEALYGDEMHYQRDEVVGPSIGKDLKRQAFWAVLWSLIGILIYVSWRFEFKYSIGAIIALTHDVLLTLAAFVLFGYEFTIPALAAILTIIGYSLNDTIVVFDRIREYMNIERPRTDKHYESVVNKAINHSLSRTVITSLTTLFVVVILFFFGGEVLKSFSFALLFGVVVGTYSSVFIASPVLIEAHLRVGKKR